MTALISAYAALEHAPAGAPPPRVSVVIPCFNYGRFLDQAVRSALEQQHVDVDVIIVDDASMDDSVVIARHLVDSSPRVRLLEQTVNRGPVETFNVGLEQARGEFLVRLDADDMLTPGSLWRSATVMRAFPKVGLVYGHPRHFTGTPPTPQLAPRGVIIRPGLKWIEQLCRSGVNVITSPEAFMRRSVVDRVGGQRPLSHTHDMEMWLRIAACSDVGYVAGVDQAWHREHGASLSQGASSAGGLTMLRERRAAFQWAFDGSRVRIPEAEELRTLASRSLAEEALGRICYDLDRRRADPASISELLEFAVETYPRATRLPAWEGVSRRLAWGGMWVPSHPWLWLRPVDRVVREHVRNRRWARTGQYESA